MRQNQQGIIVGGGIIGLALAYEFAKRGIGVTLLDRQPKASEASWAGAGILPPASWFCDQPWSHAMADYSAAVYPAWVDELRERSGIDPEFQRCGALHLPQTEAEKRQLQQRLASWPPRGIECHEIDERQVVDIEPHLLPGHAPLGAIHVPSEAQVRNPRLLAALRAASESLGAKIRYGCAVRELVIEQGRATGVATEDGTLSADFVCVAAGSWLTKIAGGIAAQAAVHPIRGQMLLLGEQQPSLRGIIYQWGGLEGTVYAVPRADGHTIVGSTVEDVGFDKSTDAATIARFDRWARTLTKSLTQSQYVTEWSGLRPASADDAPYIGVVPGVDRLYLAGGHFRAGLQMAPPTATIVASLVCGEPAPFDLQPLRVDR